MWFAIILACFIAVTGLWAGWQFTQVLGSTMSRTTTPPQLQVGRPAVTKLTWPPGRGLHPLATILDTVPGGRPARTGGYEISPTRRGKLTLGPAVLRGRDPFGLFSWRALVARPKEVLVWPGTNNVRQEVFLPVMTMIEGSTGPPTPDIDDLTLREYRGGDPLSRVYWKRPTPDGHLLVRHDDPARNPNINLLLIPGTPSATDRAVDVLASAASALASPERTMRLVTPTGEAKGALPDILTSLALAEPGEYPLPAADLHGAIVIALASGSPVMARQVVSWITASDASGESVFIFPVVDLPAESRRVLQPFTMVGI